MKMQYFYPEQDGFYGVYTSRKVIIAMLGDSSDDWMVVSAASVFPEITLTIALTPPDFILEGFYRGKRGGATE